jgi:uncharacterized membrane protein
MCIKVNVMGEDEQRSKHSEAFEQDIESNISRVVKIEQAQKDQRTLGEKLSEAIARFCGSMVFVYVHIVWFGGWIIVNSWPGGPKFDPFPYTFLTLVVSLEAIFLSTFILISQNHETKLTERRDHLDLQINMLAEQESTKTLQLIQKIARKLDIDDNDPETAALVQDVKPDELLERIVVATADDPDKAQKDIDISTQKADDERKRRST